MKSLGVSAGVYSAAEAGRLLALSPARLRRWVTGYTYHARASGSRRRIRPVFGNGSGDRDTRLSFVELIELLVAIALRKRGLSLQQIRGAASFARRSFRTDHPFATRHLFTDGRTILASTGPSLGDAAIVELARDRDTQLQFTRVMEPLVSGLEFSREDGVVARWWPNGRSGSVVLDPGICFGAPIIEGTRIRSAFVAGVAGADSVAAAARLYALTDQQVLAAVRFEAGLDER